MNLFNKILAVIYFILSIGSLIFGFSQFFKGYHTRMIDAVFILSVFIAFLIFGLIHWRISNNISGILREKFLVACSSINILIIFFGIFLVTLLAGGENYEALLLALLFFLISSFLTFLLGIASIFKTNKTNSPTVQ